MGDVSDQFSSLIVGKMAVTRGDTLLGGPRAFGVGFEELRVIVGFNEEGV